MTRPPRRLVALRHSQPFDTIRRQLVVLKAPPVAVLSEVESIMLGWLLRPRRRTDSAVFCSVVRQ